MNKVGTRSFTVLFLLLAGINLAAFIAALHEREPLTDEQWQMLDEQGVKFAGSGVEINIVKDGLSFALARRQFGGWEPAFVQLLILANLPAHMGSLVFFQALQALPFGNAKLNSDLATLFFAGSALGQWALIARWLSRKRPGQVGPPPEKVSPAA